MADQDFRVKNGLIVQEDGTILGVTDSTSKDTGALVVDGGVGVEKKITAGGTIISNTGFNRDGDVSSTFWATAGPGFDSQSGIFTDNNSANGSTQAFAAIHSYQSQTLQSLNTVNYTAAANVYIDGAVTPGSNASIADTYAFYVNDGGVKIDTDLEVTGNLSVGGGALGVGVNVTTDFSVDGNVTLGDNVNDTVTFNAQLAQAPNTLILNTNDNVAADVTEVLQLRHTTSGTPATGIGTALVFAAETSENNIEKGGIIQVRSEDATSLSEDFEFRLLLQKNGDPAAEVFRVSSVGEGVFADDLNVGGDRIETSTTTFNVINNNATTVNAFGDAATVNMLSAAGTLNLNSAIDAVSVASGALIVDGGVGITKNIYAGGIQETPIGNISRGSGAFTTLQANAATTINPANANVSITPTGTGTLNLAPAASGTMDNVTIGSVTPAAADFTTITTSGVVNIDDTTASTNNTTGALVVDGGVGVAGKISAGTMALNGNVFATNTTSGTLVVTGGVGISQNLYVGGNFEVTGDLTVNGVNADISATNLTVEDPIVKLNGKNALTQNNSKDVGVLFNYYDQQNRLGFIGFDESDKVFRILTNATIANEVVGGDRATLIANIVGDFSSDNITITGGTIDDTEIGTTTPNSGRFTTLEASGVTQITNNTNSTSTATGALVVSGGAGFALDVYAGSLQAPVGNLARNTGAFTSLAANSTVTIDGSNANVTISPTGTGSVAIEPAGGLTIAPTAAGTINNVSIGTVTRGAGNFTTLNSNGLTRFTDATQSTNTTSGGVVMSGGVGIGKKLFVGDVTTSVGLVSTGAVNLSPNNQNVTISPTGTGSVAISPATGGTINNMTIGNVNQSPGSFTALNASGLVRFTNTTASTSTSSGALVVSGGVGIADDLFIGGSGTMVGLTATGATAINPPNNNVSIQPTGSGTVTIAPATAGNINNMNIGSTTRASGAFTTLSANSTTTVTATTQSSTSGNGALVVSGGVGIAKNLNVGGNLDVVGSLTLGGGTTVIESTTLQVDDPTIQIGGNPQSDDSKDRGIQFGWHTGTASRIGFFGFDDSTGRFTFIPEATVVSDVYSGTIGTADINVNGNVTSSNADINGGAIDGTPIGGSVPSSGVFTTLQANGNTTLGDANTDTVTFNALIASSLTPSSDDQRDLGTSNNQWRNLYIDGTANIDSLVADTANIDAGTIDNTQIGSGTPNTGAFTTLTASSGVTFTANTASTNTTTGTLVVTGGLGVSGAVNAGSISAGSVSFTGAINLSPANADVTISPTGTGSVQINPGAVGDIDNMDIGVTTPKTGNFTALNANDLVRFTNTTASTSTSTGALVVSGGVGIAGDIYAGGLEGTPIGGDSASTAAFTSLTASGAVTFTQNTASSSKTTGTLVVTGGVGVSEDVYADRFVGPLVGNASSASVLDPGRTIDIGTAVTATATSFDGSQNITIPITAIDADYITSGTVDDARLPNSISSNITGNAATATALQNARLINGVSFDGTADITVFDSTKMPLGGGTFTGNVTFNDNVVLRLGTGADVEHFWNGSNYYTDINGGGNWFIRDGNSSNATRYTFDVDNGDLTMTGTLVARDKEFLIDHPTKEGMKLRHGVLEGPEHSVYVRGKLVDSKVIELPDYWTGLVHEDTITVSLTAFGDYNEYWVEKIEDNKIYIKSSYDRVKCFYHVFAERKDVDRFDVEFKED
jgi:hypothetical protein